MFAWRDGELLRSETLEPLDGTGVFETVRIHRGAPFRWTAHLERLGRGLRMLGLRPPPAAVDLEAAVRTVVDRNGVAEGLVRITVMPPLRGSVRCRTTAVPRALPEVPARVRVVVARSARREAGPLSSVKTTHREAENRAEAEARDRGAFDAILLNRAGRVVETTARNVFIVRSDRVVTPSLDEGALPGVTRAAVAEAAAGVGIHVGEGRVAVADLAQADEVFLTGSGVGVLAVNEIEGHESGSESGPVTRRLRDLYREQLESESRWVRAASR